MEDGLDNKYNVLLEKVYRGATGRGPGLSAEEIATVVTELQETSNRGKRPRLLKILGYLGDTTYQPLIERFLSGPDDGAAYAALYVLCRYWELTAQYIPQVRAFLRGLPWDDIGMVQQTAFFIAEDYLAEFADSGLLGEMIRLAAGRGVNDSTCELAQESLARLAEKTGGSPENALQEAKSRLAREEREGTEGQPGNG